MGAALGAKLASPDKTVICAVGDGAYMFGNPTAAHYVSEAMRLPVLFVIANNALGGGAPLDAFDLSRRARCGETKQPPFATLEPSPRFEHVVHASGGHGERVTDRTELHAGARARAESGEERQALNVEGRKSQRLPGSKLREDELALLGRSKRGRKEHRL